MANRFGEIRPHRLFLAVEIGQARRPLGPHGTEFYGITLTATLVERDRLSRLSVINPLGGQSEEYPWDRDATLQPVNDTTIPGVALAALRIASANREGFYAQAAMKTELAGHFDVTYGIFELVNRDIPSQFKAELITSSGDPLFSDAHKLRTAKEKARFDYGFIEGNGETIDHFYIDYDDLVMSFSSSMTPVIDCPQSPFVTRLRRDLNEHFPGSASWSIVCDRWKLSAIEIGRKAHAAPDLFLSVSPCHFFISRDAVAETPLKLQAHFDGKDVAFEPIGVARRMNLWRDIDALEARLMLRVDDDGVKASVIVAGFDWARVASNPLLSRAMAKAVLDLQPPADIEKNGPLSGVSFHLSEFLWASEPDLSMELRELDDCALMQMFEAAAKDLQNALAENGIDLDEPGEQNGSIH